MDIPWSLLSGFRNVTVGKFNSKKYFVVILQVKVIVDFP